MNPRFYFLKNASVVFMYRDIGSIQKQEYMYSGTPSQVKIRATIQAEKGQLYIQICKK